MLGVEERRTDNTRVALDAIRGALDSIDHDARRDLGPAERLDLVTAAIRVADRLVALRAVLVAEADAVGATHRVAGTPMTSWLTSDGRTSRREAAALVFTGRDVVAHDSVRCAALSGAVTIAQTRAITRAMGELPVDLRTRERDAAENLLLELASATPAEQIGKLAPSVLAAVAPEHPDVPRCAEERATSQRQLALRRRRLSWRHDGEGSVEFEASLPEIEASSLIKVIEAHLMPARDTRRSAADARDPRTFLTSIEQRRADALVAAMLDTPSDHRFVGGERPRVVVTMNEQALRHRAEQAGLLDSGAVVSAGDLRRLCCDADLMPVVLGSDSEILDVGVTHRLATPAIRRALAWRDGGCAFPGCDVSAMLCDAHHIDPWWRGGATSLNNLVLLCPHHHALIEPPRFWSTATPDDRWAIRLDESGHPVTIPPAQIDPARTPLRPMRGQRADGT